MRSVVLCATLAAALLPSRAAAQSLSLTEADMLARLSGDSPRVRAIRAGTDIVRAEALSASRWPNPRVTVDRESVAGVTEYLTMVAQPLPITGRRRLEIQAASALVDASTTRADDVLRRARADLRLAYAQLIAAQAREQSLTGARDRLRDLAGILAKREGAGDVSGFDRLRAEREVSDVDADVSAAATDRSRAQAAIASFFADAVDPSRIVAAPQAASSTEVPAVGALVERALAVRGELLALQKEAEAARLSAGAADRRRIPETEIVAGTKSSTSGGGDIGSVVTVQAVIPLFDRGKPERALAEARAKQADAQADMFRITLRSEITALRAEVAGRREAAARYRTAAVGGAGEIERIARVSYDAGERGILELLDAYRTGIDRARPPGGARSHGAAGRNRAGIRQRLGDSLMKTLLMLIALAATGCAREATAPPKEAPMLNVTNWTSKTELYMEYPPLVAGHAVRFAVHLTKLDDFQALNAGTPSIELTPESGGAKTTLHGTAPSRPGAFRVDGTPPAAGRYRWALLVDAPGLNDRHELGNVTVFADEAAAKADADKRAPDDPSAIAYLKEQQWTNAFATAPVREAELRTSIKAPATIEPVSGGEAIVSAPAAGRFLAQELVSIGATVRAGQTLGRLEPRLSGADDRATMSAELAQAQAAPKARAPNRRAPNGCSPTARFPLAASRMRAVLSRRAKLAYAPPKPGSRSATRRSAAAAAPRPATRSRFARRSPAGWRTCSPRSARRTTKARRSSRSSRPMKSSCACRCRRPTPRCRVISRASRSRFRAAPIR